MTRLFLASAVLLTMLNGPTSARPVHDCGAPVQLPTPAKADLAVASTGHRIITAAINGVEVPLVVDSGGMGVGGALDAQRLANVQTAGTREAVSAHGAHGSGQMQLEIIDRVNVGGGMVDELPFLVTEAPLFPADQDAGVLGSRFLCQFLVEFDFADNTITLYDRETDPGNVVDASWRALDFENFRGTGGILVDVLVNGVPVKAALDTGSTFTGINWAAAEKAGVGRDTPGLRTLDVPAHGLNATGAVTTNEYGFDIAWSADSPEQRDDAVRVADIPAMRQLFGDQPGMILGLNVMNGHRLVVDYARSRLYIRTPAGS